MATTHSTVVVVADDGTSPVGTDEWNIAHVDKYQPTEDVSLASGLSVVNTDPYILDSGRLLTLASGAVAWTDSAVRQEQQFPQTFYRPMVDQAEATGGMTAFETDPLIVDQDRVVTLPEPSLIWLDAPRPSANSLGFYNVKDYGAVGDAVTNDAVAIDKAVAAARITGVVLGGGGGIVYFPPGHYIYNGAGIVNNPPSSIDGQVLLQGAGPQLTIIEFTGVTNAEAIKLTTQAAVGSGRNYGGGVKDMRIWGFAGVDVITVSALESFTIENVRTWNGKNALNVSESRDGRVKDCFFDQWTGYGIQVTGTAQSYNHYEDIRMNGTGASQWGFDYSTSTTLSDGIVLRNVAVNAAGQGGFRFQKTTAGIVSIFLFAEACIADALTFGADCWSFKNVQYVEVTNLWAVQHGSNLNAVTIDGCAKMTFHSGNAYADTGTGSQSAFSFLNTCDSIAVYGVFTYAGGATPGYHYRVDGTHHTNMDIQAMAPIASSGSFTNTPDNLVANAVAQLPPKTPFIVQTSGNNTGGAFGLMSGTSPFRKKFMRIDSTGTLQFLDDAWTKLIYQMSDSGTVAYAVQTPVFAASYTPLSDQGPIIKLGLLTANLTVNAPTAPTSGLITGMQLSFHFQQDGTGGRTVTWNAVFVKTWSDTGNTLNTRSSITFQYDGTNWLQVGAQRTWA